MEQIALSGSNLTAKLGEIGLDWCISSKTNLTVGNDLAPNFAAREEPLDDETAAMKAAREARATRWNAGPFYGFGPSGEMIKLELIARFFDKYPELED